MASFFKRLLGRGTHRPALDEKGFNATVAAAVADVYDPTNNNDRLGLALLATLRPQLELLGYDYEQVPAVEPFVSHKCRGALMGLSSGLLEAEGIEATKDAALDSLLAVFVLVFGDAAGRSLAQQTVEDLANGEPDLMEAYQWSKSDVLGVYEKGGVTSAVGFYVAAQQMI